MLELHPGEISVKNDLKQPLVKNLPFRPLAGLSSPHIQTILACLTPSGEPPPSASFLIPLDDGDVLTCEISTPSQWQETEKTIALIHGLGGNHRSSYMIRVSRKLYEAGYRTIRINMRGCGSENEIDAKRPYHGGISQDALAAVKKIKQDTPLSPLILVGFSLGGNIALKLAGELGEIGPSLLHSTIAICPPVDLAETARLIGQPSNILYNRYYMRQLERVAKRWIKNKTLSNIFEYDNMITAPQWGFQSAADYYRKCSSCFLLPNIKHPCHLLFSADDPFINYKSSLVEPMSSFVNIWLSPFGGHMGFFGWTGKNHGCYWLDSILLKWISEF